MKPSPSMAALRPEQGPPLAIPASFFVTAPLAVMTAGVLLSLGGVSLLWTRFAGGTAALAHLGTLGLLGSVMLGALYQMLPVVAGAPVPGLRAAHAVHALFVTALSLMVWGLWAAERTLVVAGATLLSLALLGFLLPVSLALARTAVAGPTVTGMRLAVLGLGLVVGLGLWLGYTRGSGGASPAYPSVVIAHLTLGLVAWVGGLIAAVSFQVVPMFYLTPPAPRWVTSASSAAMALTLAGLTVALVLRASPGHTALAALPGALSAWLLHPLATLVAIARRRRKRADPSLTFWRVGLVCGLASLPCAGLALYADDSRFGVLFGWVVVWGWAALIVHGMLGRIVPFLVWLHRFSKRVGLEPVPSMKQLLPDALPRAGLALHVTTLCLGVAALATGLDPLARATGVGLLATGAAMLLTLLRPLLHRARASTERDARP